MLRRGGAGLEADLKKEIANLVGVLSSGVVSEAISETLAAKESEHKRVGERLAELEAASVHVDDPHAPTIWRKRRDLRRCLS